jgi:hypothetical protein
LARIHLTNFEAKTVGAQINGGVQGLVVHEWDCEAANKVQIM